MIGQFELQSIAFLTDFTELHVEVYLGYIVVAQRCILIRPLLYYFRPIINEAEVRKGFPVSDNYEST